MKKPNKSEILGHVNNIKSGVLDRNSQILKSIEQKQTPILQFELDLALGSLQKYIKKQQQLGKSMSEAMSQSSETWHDNAPADVIREELKILVQTAEQKNRIINSAEVFDYETNPEMGATLGSLIGVCYDEFEENTKLFLTGATHTLPPEIREIVGNPNEEIEIITLAGPMGRQILGKKPGDKFDLIHENKSKIPITVTSLEHINIEI